MEYTRVDNALRREISEREEAMGNPTKWRIKYHYQEKFKIKYLPKGQS